MKKTATTNVVLPNYERRRVALRLVGTSPLLVKRFDEKAITQILCKQGGIPYERKNKSPQEDFEAAKYRNTNGDECIPAAALRHAMVGAAGFDDNMTKTLARGAFRIVGECIPLKWEHLENRLDMVRNSGLNRTCDVRFRPEYHGWSADIVVDYNPRLITIDQLIYLARESGTAIGICEWRPMKNGNHGTYDVEVLEDIEIERIVKASSVPREPLKLPEFIIKAMLEGGASLGESVDDLRSKATGRKRGKAKPAADDVEVSDDEAAAE